MSVTINVHYFMPHLTSDQEVVEVNGGTVVECIEDLAVRFPRSREWLFRKNGDLGSSFEVYVNDDSLLPGELTNPVRDGDRIYLVMMISGG